jgi:hypothetical protein
MASGGIKPPQRQGLALIGINKLRSQTEAVRDERTASLFQRAADIANAVAGGG